MFFTYRPVRTAILYLSYIAFGTACGVFGPAWPDLGIKLRLSDDQMKYGLTVRSVATILICAVSGFFLNRSNRELLYLLLLLVCSITLVLMPLLPSQAVFLILQFIFGIPAALIGVLGNVWILDIWRESEKGMVAANHGLQFAFGVGTLVAPLVVRPFLLDVPAGGGSNGTMSTTISPEPIEESQIQVPFYIIGGFVALVSLTIIPLIRFHREGYEEEVHEPGDLKVDASTDIQSIIKRSPKARLMVLAHAAAIFFFLEGMDLTNGSYFFTFLISTGLKVSKSQAAYIDSAYVAANTLAKLAGVLIGLRVKPVHVMLVNFGLLSVANIMFYLYMDSSESALLVASILQGAAFGTAWANLLALLSNYLTITNSVVTLIVVSDMISAAIYPIIIGGRITSYPIVLVYLNAGSIVMSFIFFISLLLYIKYVRRCAVVSDVS